MKRITSSLLALLLALSMLIGMVPAVYAADNTDTIESIDSTETVDSSETEDVSDESEDVAAQVAGGTGVAKIGSTVFNSLDDAIDYAKTQSGGVIVELLANTEITNDTLSLDGLTIKSSGTDKFEIKGLKAIAGTGIALENVYLNLTGTLNIGGTNTTLTNCTIRAKDLGYNDVYFGGAYASAFGVTSSKSNSYLTRVTGTNVTMTDCTIDGTSNDETDAYFPNMCLAQVSGTNVTMTRCTFNEGFAACYYSMPRGTWTLDGCKFTNVYCYNVQAGDTPANIVVKNCELAGWTSFGSDMASVSFENCSFAKSSGYATVVAYKDATFTNCMFTEDYKGKLYVEPNTTVELNSCKVVNSDGNVSTTVALKDIADTQKQTTNLVAIDATKDENGGYTGGTFVGNEETIKGKLASGCEYNPTTGTVTSGSSTTAITTSEQLIAAIAAANDGDTITLGEGVFSTYGKTSPKKSLTFVGSGEGTVWTIGDLTTDVHGEANGDYSFEGCDTITFKDMKLKADNKNYRGFIRINNTVVDNCVLEGRTAYWGYEKAKFINSTFEAPEGDYALWDYSTKDMTFDSCTFNISGKGVNVYVEADNVGSATRAVTVKDCTVNSTAEDKAFLNIKNSTQAYDVTFSGTNEVNGLAANDTTNSNLFQVQTTEVTETSGKPVTVKKTAGDGTENVIYEVKAPTAAAKIGDTAYETLDAAITAVKDGETIIVNAGEYKLNGSLTYSGKAFTIKAADDAKVSFDMSAAVALHGAKITFENVTFDYKTNGNYIGMQHTDTLVYNSCTINGQAFLYATNETFNNCTFKQTSKDAYNVWTYGAKNVAFNSCTFECVGKSVLVYNEGTNTKTDLKVKDSTFTASAPVDGKAAIEIDTSLMQEGATITIEGTTTASGFATGSNSGNTLWNDKKQTEETNKNTTVIVNGETVFAPKSYVAQVGDKKCESVAEAINNAAEGETVLLLADTTEDVVINKDITLDLGGKTLTNTNAGKATISVTGGTVTVKNGSVVGGTSYYNIEVTKGSNANLTLEDVTATAGNTGSSMIDNWATLTITSGEYTGGLNVVKSEEGSKLTINGGKFTLNYAPSSGYTATILVYGDTTITGGEFIQNATPKWGYPQVVMTGLVEGYTAITRITGGSYTNKKSGDNIFHGLGKATSDNFEVSGGTFNKSIPAGYCADGYIPTKNADGTYGVKEGKYVAKIGSTGYEKLADAIKAATSSSKIVKLVANVTESIEIASNKTRTLDLNGFTLTNTEGEHTIVNNGTLTIKDSSTAQTGTVDNVTHGRGALVNNGTVILSGGTFERSAEKGTLEPYGNGGNSWYTISNYGTMTINNGTTVKNAGGYSSNIRNGGQDSTAKLTINGGTFDGGVNTVKNDANGVLEIKGGELKNTAQYVIMNWNQATISGGTFETAETAGAVLFSSAYGTDGTACGELTITGGTFKAAGNELIDDAYDADNHGTVKISGGSFNRAVDPKHCDTGFIPTQNEDGTYGVKAGIYVAEVKGTKYETLQAAIDAANRKQTVKLLANTRENVTISTDDLTLDLNGFTLNGSTGECKPALTVTARRVTVKDGSEAKTGTIMREDTAENSGVLSHYVIDIQGNGLLFFESGKVKNDSGVDGKGAYLVRVGNDEDQKYPGLTIKGGTFTQDNFTVIKVYRGTLYLNDGTLNSANSYAIEDWHRATIKGGTVNGAVAAWTYSGGPNSDLTISGGTINGDVTSVNYGNAEGKTAKVSITGGRVTGELDTRSYNPATSELTSINDATKATIGVTGGTFNLDPTKYVVEGSTVNQNADGTFVVEKAYLAKVGETSYYTMDEAFKAQTASGEPILLLRDYTTGSTFNSGTINRTVDLNGHTWTCTGTDANSAAFEINNPNVTLTVKNGKIVSSQLVGLIPSAMGGTIKYDNSGLVFEGVEMSTTATSGIETNGSNTNDSVTLRNSTLNVPNGFGIYFPSSGTLTIENSKINAKTMGVQVCAGSLKISGDKTAITVTGDAVPKTENDGAIQDGAAISIVNRTGYKGLGTITVTGGTFTAKDGNAAIKAYDWANNTATDFTEPTKVEVSGGTFSAEVPAALCAPGYVPTKNADGTYGVKEGSYVAAIGEKKYATLAAAVDAAKDGDTITLIADVEQNTMLVIKKEITLNLDGKKIFNTTDIWSDTNGTYELLSIEAKVTITGNGTIDAKENDCYTINVKNGDLTIENGTFYGNVSVVQVEAGMLTINGGKFDLHQKWEGKNTYLINCIDDAFVDKTAKVAIYGGEFVDFDPNVSPEKKIDGKTPSFAAPGVGITKNENNTFTAKANMVAQIVDADGNSVAAYASLAEAVATAKDNEIVKLIANTDISKYGLTITKTITLDLNGYEVKAANTNPGNIAVAGKLTLMDSTDTKRDGTGKGKITTNTPYASGTRDKVLIAAMDGGTFIMESGLIDAASFTDDNANNGQFAVSVQNENGDAAVIINGGHIKAGWYAVAGNGTCTKHNGDITVNGGILESTADYAIYHPHTGTTTINGGTIYGAAGGVSLNRGKLVVNGGTITSKGTGSTGDWGDGTGKQDAAAINVNAQYDSTSVEIKGGTITAENNAILLTNGRNGTIAVSGGQFSHEVKAEYCAIGYQPKTTQDPNTKLYTVEKVSGNAYYVDNNGKPVYGDFAALVASTNTATKGKTITLLKDVKIEDNLVLFGNRTVDLNGNVLEITEIFIGLYGKVIDSSDGNGLLKIAADNVTLQSDNGLLPIYDSAKGGYRLFSFTMREQVTKPSDTTVKFKFGPIFENKEAYKLLLTGNNHNIKVTVTLKWISGDGRTGEQTFTFPQNLINGIGAAEGGSGFVINLTGFDSDITGSVSNVTAQWAISSGTGASVSGTPSVIYE